MGKYIAIEGIDGAGKTTICNLLLQKLSSSTLIKQPSSEEIGNFIRKAIENEREFMKDPFISLLLFFSDTLSLREKIKKLKKEYNFIISDRSFLSTYAYQLALVRNKEEKEIFVKIFNELLKLIEIPDIIIILDVEVEVGIERLKKSSRKLSIYENKDFLKAALENYRNFELELDNVYLIDANRSIYEVLDDVIKVIQLL